MKLFWSLTLILTLLGSSFATAQIPVPCGIGGIVSLNEKPVSGLELDIININTGETKTVKTRFNLDHTLCGYFVALSGQTGQFVFISATYNGKNFYNYVVINDKLPQQWLNLSIQTENQQNNGEINFQEITEEIIGNNPDNSSEEQNNQSNNIAIENKTSYFQLIVHILENDSKEPLYNAFVSIYNNTLTLTAGNYTNESGMISFILKEGEYIVTIEKDDYITEQKRITLSTSAEYILYMKESSSVSIQLQGTNQRQEQESPFIYIGLFIIGIVCVVSIILWKTKSRWRLH